MSAAILREAAALMRSRAEAATPAPEMGPRAWMVDPDEPAVVLQPDEPTGWDGYAIALTHSDEADRYIYAPHIASWHPAVALAVADWLDEQSQRPVTFGHPLDNGTPVVIFGPDPRAVAVARAYLGEATDG